MKMKTSRPLTRNERLFRNLSDNLRWIGRSLKDGHIRFSGKKEKYKLRTKDKLNLIANRTKAKKELNELKKLMKKI